MADDDNRKKEVRVLASGILIGSILGLSSFIALFGVENLRDNDFLAGLWTLMCMVAVGFVVSRF